MVRGLLWHIARFLWTVESTNRRLPPWQGPIWYYQSWTRCPTPPPLQPSIPVTQGWTRWWRACRRICLVLLHTVHVSWSTARTTPPPCTRIRRPFRWVIPVNYFGPLDLHLKVTNRSLKQRVSSSRVAPRVKSYCIFGILGQISVET
jgi:hypothetical protein